MPFKSTASYGVGLGQVHSSIALQGRRLDQFKLHDSLWQNFRIKIEAKNWTNTTSINFKHVSGIRIYSPTCLLSDWPELFSYQENINVVKSLNKYCVQAVEYLAEWSLTPTNVAFFRVHTGLYDPREIGDKVKWFGHTLDPVRFVVWDECSSLNSALRSVNQQEQPTGLLPEALVLTC